MRWLERETERWIAEGIITGEQAARIRGLYTASTSALSLGLIVFFGLGAVVVGLGVILLLAYNWSDIPKFGKLGLILGSILAAHGAGYRLRSAPDWRAKLAEALSLLGTMLYGAGIWLVAQIYNIDEHFPNGFLLWALGALALAWALDSIAQAMAAAVLIACWAGAEAIGFSSTADLAVLLLLVGVGPLAWRRRSPLLCAVALGALYWVWLCNAAVWGGAAGAFGNGLALSVLLLGAARLGGEGGPAGVLRPVVRGLGLLGFTVCAYLLTFHDIVESILRWHTQSEGVVGVGYRVLMFVAACGVWVLLLVRTVLGRRPLVRMDEWLFPIALLYAEAMGVWGVRGDAEFVSIVFNLVCLGIATAWMVRGCRSGNLGLVMQGSLLLALVVFARYFDLFSSLAVRGLVFVVFGGILFAEGFFYRRLRSAGEEERP